MQKGNREKKKWKNFVEKEKIIPSIYDFISKPLEAGLWCLLVSKQKFNNEYIGGKDIENILINYLDIKIGAIQVKRAFARAGNKIFKNPQDDSYKICKPGEDYLKSLKKDEPISVFYLKSSKPIQAKHTLEALVKNIPRGELRICDPFYGTATFHVLEMILKYHKKVKFLTAALGGREKKSNVQQIIKDFKKEYKSQIEIKTAVKNDTHDRYIIANNLFFIIGQGIKDLGNKESLIVAVEDKYGRDIRKILINEFDRRWNNAAVL